MRGQRAGLGLLILLAAWLGSCSPSPPSPVPSSADWFIETEREGGLWLSPETMRALGIDPLAEATPLIRLSWADRVLPHLPLRTSDGWGVFFFAPDRATRYTRRTVFRLETGVAGETMAEQPFDEAQGTPFQAADGLAGLPHALAFTHWEEDNRYLPQAAAETPWFWEPLYSPGAVTHTLTLAGALAGPVTATLHLWSHTASSVNPDHFLRLIWDGREVGEWRWDGQGMRHFTASWQEGRAAGEHTLVVETPALPGVDVAAVWLDGWDVTYRRQVVADGSVWQAEGTALRVAGDTSAVRVIDVSDPFAPRDWGHLAADGVAATVAGHRYWIGIPAESPAPLAVRPARSVGQIGNPSYLILAPPEFHAALQPLLERRRDDGLTAAVVDPGAIYDDFGSGRPDPEALRFFIQSLPSLRYLLVVGDGSAQPWGYDGEAGALRAVVPLTRTALLGETPADGWLGTDREGHPSVAVGRFPATSADEVTVMVEKTLRWESQGGPAAILLLNDDETEFTEAAEEIAALLPSGVLVQRLDTSRDEASRAAALEALGQGPVWLNYTGHGSLTLLGDEGVLTVEDGGDWQEPALVVAWTCLAAHFIHPVQDSMAETWLRASRGGAVAFLGPTGETTSGEQQPFARVFYQTFVEGQRLGDAWLTALQAGGSQDVIWGFVLLGDPALRLRE